ncbi:uncharacterized protein SOCEGT47_072970 [Sorangium cellulosum]|uniref:Uncharacterized protein n=1 Tax=Sorangium cellulosum TaxID=56 RepID=A0A4P2QAN2_SORCE|nr:hypothetical protein [Sorangium cellulosum]AUX26727.1 uncharacterized protein SOCEGT47_072970 [Sorangium cellulosum]
MIELVFKVTGEDGVSRDIVVRIHEPRSNPSEEKRPWAVTVDVDGRTFTTWGDDPLDAVENGARHAAILLRGLHGDALDPPLEPRMKEDE